MKILISHVRQKKGLSGAELSRRTNIPKSTLNELENGIRSPRLDQLEQIAIALHCGVNDLFDTEYR